MTRIAIISTPRSGNTWLRRLLSHAYSAKELAFHTPSEVPWNELPEHCILQIHWPRTSTLVDLLEHNHFHVVVLARHPLDVLLSILQFSPHEKETSRWLNGEGGNEDCIHNVSPTSQAFLNYCLSVRAKALLSVSLQWWVASSVMPVKYEALVSDPSLELRKIATQLTDDVSKLKIEEAVLANSFSYLQSISINNHFWKGKPGIWRELLPAATADRIAIFHDKSYRILGYSRNDDHFLEECLVPPILDART
jgi:Sulfotransferase domain